MLVLSSYKNSKLLKIFSKDELPAPESSRPDIEIDCDIESILINWLYTERVKKMVQAKLSY